MRRETSLCEIDVGGEGMRVLDDFVEDVDLLEVEEEVGRVVAIADLKMVVVPGGRRQR